MSWGAQDATQVPIDDDMLQRSLGGMPFIKDLFEIASKRCTSDEDVILYTNSDIGIVSEKISFPSSNFFLVRKNVEKPARYSKECLEMIPFEKSINADGFGVTKKWWNENKDSVPDFVIGRPYWDLAFIMCIQGARMDNVIFHVAHESEWKKSSDFLTEHNKNTFFNYLRERKVPICDEEFTKLIFHKYVNYMSQFGFRSVENPVFITFFTPSHEELFRKYFLPSFIKTFGKKYRLEFKMGDQSCTTGAWHSSGWRKTQCEKVSYVLDTLESIEDGQMFVFCDADIVHLQDYSETLRERLQEAEIVIQKSFKERNICSKGCFHRSENNHIKRQVEESVCSGFYAARKSPKIIKFIKDMLNELISEVGHEENADQYFFNKNKEYLRYEMLDEKFFNPGFSSIGKKIEENDFEENISNSPPDALLLHANWIVGHQAKNSYIEKFMRSRPKSTAIPKVKMATIAESYALDLDHMIQNQKMEFFIFHMGERKSVENVNFLPTPQGLNLYDAGAIKNIIGEFDNYGIFSPHITLLDLDWLFPYLINHDFITQYFNCTQRKVDFNLLISKNTEVNMKILMNRHNITTDVGEKNLSLLCNRFSKEGQLSPIRLYS
jgi:hypothetical protein